MNTARFAEVWLDDYVNFYKYMNPGMPAPKQDSLARNRQEKLNVSAAKQIEVGVLSQRRQLLSDLKCHSFKWFIENVYKDAPFPNGDLYFGQVPE